ncbi:MAG: toxin-antitoxin system HicB family antitoxin [Acidobacteria bacterium]|nr:toxin-antitoxin system HicB family antitoxin [Acidobacteriota bacterium]MCA1641792.1 toxin-antitoxin system HicB family antitoxin [Acidobacteriota bacterium]
MSTTEIKLPAELLRRAREMAEQENMTLEQFASSALAEKMAAWKTVAYLEERAARGDKRKFERALDSVPDAEPETFDRL